MASKPRNYQAWVPAVVTFRWAFRLDLFKFEEALILYFLKLLAHWSWECGVVVLGVAVRGNHAHILLLQQFDGCDRHKGISAMLRNVLSALAKAANITFSHQGRIVERTYRSHNLHTLGDLVRQYAYLHSQDAWHRAEGGADSLPTLVDVESADGVVTQIPVIPGLCDPGVTAEERGTALAELFTRMSRVAVDLGSAQRQEERTLEQSLDPLTRALASNPWHTALRQVAGEQYGLPLEADVRQQEFLSVMGISDAKTDAFLKSRERMRRWHFPQFEFQPRRAPHVGDIFEVRIVRLVQFVDEGGHLGRRVLDAPPVG